MRRLIFALLAFFLPVTAAFSQQNEKLIQKSIDGATFMPAKVDASDNLVATLTVPSGFKVSKFAEGLGHTRMMAAGSDGTIYITRREQGDVIALKDNNGDGRSDGMNVVAVKKDMHGIYIHNNTMYLATVKEVYTAEIKPDGTLGELNTIITDLPDGGQHPNRTLAVGPDNKLYISIGSTCNECKETNNEHAAMLVANLDGTNRRVYASGLRNTIGYGWHPVTKEMWGMDHGIDWLGDNEQAEELNRIEENGNYGWPFIYEMGKFNEKQKPKEKISHEEYARLTKFPRILYQAHSSPLQMVFYTGTQFPEDYRNDAFICMRGSWNRSTPSGYKVVRINFEDGQPAGFEDFVSDFLTEDNKSHFGRVAGITMSPDGSIYFCDDANGNVYKVTYEG
jgi:glucose/arabinose dehydrogenase